MNLDETAEELDARTRMATALQRLGQDPAQSSSIFLTTVTDVVGFATFLGLAAMFAPLLT